MAKKYLEVFLDSQEQHYGSGITPIASMSQLTSGVKLTPIFQSNGAAGRNEYAIQRGKRIKATDSQMNPDAAETAGASAFGTELVAGLNDLTKVQWDTVELTTAKERLIGVTVDPFEEVSPLEEATLYTTAISDTIKNTLAESEENLTSALVASGGTAVGVALTGTTNLAKAEEVADAILGEVRLIQELVDDYKAYSSEVVVVIHPRLADLMGMLQGQGYQLGTNTFPNGLGTSFSYQGINFYVSPILNAFDGSASTEGLGAIVYDTDALVYSGIQNQVVEFDESYLGTRAVGHRYHEIVKVIDPTRVKLVEFTRANAIGKTNAKSAKVND